MEAALRDRSPRDDAGDLDTRQFLTVNGSGA
jgi:hypothetical protein